MQQAKTGDTKMVARLLQEPKVNPNKITSMNYNRDAHEYAAIGNHLETLKLIRSHPRFTPFHDACELITAIIRSGRHTDNTDVLKVLLSDKRMDFNLRRTYVDSPMCCALVNRKDDDALHVLISSNRSDLGITEHGKILVCLTRRQMHLAELLIDNGYPLCELEVGHLNGINFGGRDLQVGHLFKNCKVGHWFAVVVYGLA